MPSRIRLQKYIVFNFTKNSSTLFSPKGKVAFFAFHRKKRLKDHLSRPFFFRFPPQKKKEYAPTSELGHILFFSFEVYLPLEQYYSATSGSRGH